ncbi:hypothetical protein EB796_001000 [Bugula neritina]|uniref:Uncharacterized protein n=1 Tax=Bugula neritina TaxID=10212 RepID=A0A7J7KR89_BUGNE|nr:hypothetical protein EB796_001000 [Bugula neritina]
MKQHTHSVHVNMLLATVTKNACKFIGSTRVQEGILVGSCDGLYTLFLLLVSNNLIDCRLWLIPCKYCLVY